MSRRRWLSSLLAGLSFCLLSPGWSAEVLGCFPFTLHRGYLWVDVQAQGAAKPLHFLLDSGAASTLVDRATAQRLGVPLGKAAPVRGISANTVGCEVRGWSARVGSLPLPSALLAIDLRALGITSDRPIDGLLGADFIEGHIVQIDYPAHQVRFLGAASPSANCHVLPLKSNQHCWLAPVHFGNWPEQWMRVDTGCDSAVEWVIGGKAKDPHAATTVAVTNAAPPCELLAVRLGNLPLKAMTGLHHERFFPKEDGLLGNGVLSQFVVTLDTPHHQLILESAVVR